MVPDWAFNEAPNPNDPACSLPNQVAANSNDMPPADAEPALVKELEPDMDRDHMTAGSSDDLLSPTRPGSERMSSAAPTFKRALLTNSETVELRTLLQDALAQNTNVEVAAEHQIVLNLLHGMKLVAIGNPSVPVAAEDAEEASGQAASIETGRASVVNLHEMAETDRVRFIQAAGMYVLPFRIYDHDMVLAAICGQKAADAIRWFNHSHGRTVNGLVWITSIVVGFLVWFGVLPKSSAWLTPLGSFFPLFGIFEENRFLARQMLFSFETWYILGLLGVWSLCMAKLFYFDERTAFLVPFWVSIVFVIFHDAASEQLPIVGQAGIGVGVIVSLITMLALHYDWFPGLQRLEIDDIGGHAIDVVLYANRSLATICLFLCKNLFLLTWFPEFKIAITCPIAIEILTVGEFQAEQNKNRSSAVRERESVISAHGHPALDLAPSDEGLLPTKIGSEEIASEAATDRSPRLESNETTEFCRLLQSLLARSTKPDVAAKLHSALRLLVGKDLVAVDQEKEFQEGEIVFNDMATPVALTKVGSGVHLHQSPQGEMVIFLKVAGIFKDPLIIDRRDNVFAALCGQGAGDALLRIFQRDKRVTIVLTVVWLMCLALTWLVWTGVLPAWASWFTLLGVFFPLSGILLLNKYLAKQMLYRFEIWYLVFLVTVWATFMGDVFDDERAVTGINLWIGTVGIIFQDAISAKRPATASLAVALTILAWLMEMVCVHYDLLPDLNRQKVPVAGGHTLDVVLSANRTLAVLVIYFFKTLYVSLRHPGLKAVLAAPVELKRVTVAEFLVECAVAHRASVVRKLH